MISNIEILAADSGISPGPTGVPTAPPVGFRPLSQTIDGLSDFASSLLTLDYGVKVKFQSDKKLFMARVEPHPPAPERNLTDWHKGVTVYESTSPEGTVWNPLLLLSLAACGIVGYYIAISLKP